MPSSSSLDSRFSDFVGSSSLNINDKVSLNYNFSLDQNYQDFNYNEIGTSFTNDRVKFNINYLEEKDHIGNQEYFKSNIEIGKRI